MILPAVLVVDCFLAGSCEKVQVREKHLKILWLVENLDQLDQHNASIMAAEKVSLLEILIREDLEQI